MLKQIQEEKDRTGQRVDRARRNSLFHSNKKSPEHQARESVLDISDDILAHKTKSTQSFLNFKYKSLK